MTGVQTDPEAHSARKPQAAALRGAPGHPLRGEGAEGRARFHPAGSGRPALRVVSRAGTEGRPAAEEAPLSDAEALGAFLEALAGALGPAAPPVPPAARARAGLSAKILPFARRASDIPFRVRPASPPSDPACLSGAGAGPVVAPGPA